MGANAQTSVPAFTAGQVLTAAQMTQVNTGIPVFASSTERDAAFGGTGEKTLAEGQMAYLEDTNETQYYDGSAWAAVGGAGGLVPLVTEDFTTVSAVNIDNVFTADYRAYKIVFRLTGLSASVSMLWRLRAAGVSKTANYNTERLYGFGTTPSASENPSGTDDWYLGSPSNTHSDKMLFEATLFDPYSTNTKVAISQSTYRDTTYHNSLVSGHYLTDTDQLDGMMVAPSSGTFSGTITIYGMAEAT